MRLGPFAAVVGMILAAGCGGGGGSDTAQVPAVQLPSGKLDPTFGDAGKVALNGTDAGMAVGPDGSVYVTGVSIRRIDTTGKVSTFFTVSDSARFEAPIIDESGNLIALYSPDHYNNHVVKIDASGRLVTSFGTNAGVATLPFDPSKTSPFGLARDGKGNLYALGNEAAPSGVVHMVIAKLDANGRQVQSFGDGGLASFGLGAHTTYGWAIVADAEGNIYVAGGSIDDHAPLVVKFDADGKRSTSFGAGGVWLGPACSAGSGATAIAMDSAPNLYVTTGCPGPLVKIDPAGRTVDSFREGGLRKGLFGADPGSPLAMTVRPNGDIYVGGFATAATECADFAIAKLDADGNAAPEFGSNGVARFDVAQEWITDLGFDGQGRLYAAGPVSYCRFAHTQTYEYVVYRLGR